MRIRRWLASALPTALVLVGLFAIARGDISSEVLTANAMLSPVQQQVVDAHVRDAVAKLINGSEADVIKARTDLLDPFDKGPGDIFRIAYSSSLVRELTPALASTRPMTRLNAMIVAARVVDASAIKLVQRGLEDGNPGVRYWAAKAAGQIAQAKVRETPLLSAAEQSQLLETLAAASGKEESPEALQQEFVAMGRLTIPQAAVEVLKSLNARVDAHASNPAMGLAADTEGLRQLYARLVAENAVSPVSKDILRQLAVASYRYLSLTADMLFGGKLSPDMQAQAWSSVATTDQTLRWVVAQLDPHVKLPPEIKDFIASHSPAGVKLRNEQNWRPLLLAAPLSFGAETLAVPGK